MQKFVEKTKLNTAAKLKATFAFLATQQNIYPCVTNSFMN